jgi:hypothetical protein
MNNEDNFAPQGDIEIAQCYVAMLSGVMKRFGKPQTQMDEMNAVFSRILSAATKWAEHERRDIAFVAWLDRAHDSWGIADTENARELLQVVREAYRATRTAKEDK